MYIGGIKAAGQVLQGPLCFLPPMLPYGRLYAPTAELPPPEPSSTEPERGPDPQSCNGAAPPEPEEPPPALPEAPQDPEPPADEAAPGFPPDFEKFWRAARDNPHDFSAWTELLQYVEQEVGNELVSALINAPRGAPPLKN